MKLGDYEIFAVQTGEFRLDGGAMFGVVPKVIWEKTNPADEKNRIRMATRSLLVKGKGKAVLVDCGIGTKWEQKQIDMYAIDHSRFTLEASLAKTNTKLEDITHLVLTHLHFDHVGGATRLNTDKKAELTFPKAEILVHEENLTHAHAPTEKDKASFVGNTIQPLRDAGVFKSVSKAVEIMPGVSTYITHGHTPGQQLLKVTSGGKTALFCGDTIPTASHVPLPFVMGYDLYPMTTIDEKRKFLPQAFEEKWILVWAHDPVTAASTVGYTNGKFHRGEDVIL